MMAWQHRLGAVVFLIAPSAAGASCTRSPSAVGRAVAVTAAAATLEVAAAAVNKAASGCYTTCAYGTACNRETGLCEPRGDCHSGLSGTSANCGMTPEYLRATSDPGAIREPAADAPLDESCAGFCLSTERCVVYRGDLDCVPRSDPRPATRATPAPAR